jgi:formyltetrahydrofolate-dependent phosphoribosylglycinamide formyltransferase
MPPSRLVVLASGEGTLLQHLIDGCDARSVPGQIVAVGADRDGTRAVSRATAAGIPTFSCRVYDYPDRGHWDKALTEICAGYQPDLVICAGFLKLLGPVFLGEFAGRCINSHPALLPSFPGLDGVRDALAYGVKVTGCTIFLVDAGLDSGPVIAQAAVPVRDDDDQETLRERVKAAERILLTGTVAAMLAGGWSVSGRRVQIGSRTDWPELAEQPKPPEPPARPESPEQPEPPDQPAPPEQPESQQRPESQEQKESTR